MFDRKSKSKSDPGSDHNSARRVMGGPPADASSDPSSPSAASRSSASDTSTFNDHLTFEGKLSFSGTLVVNGTIRGSVHTEDTLKVGAKGRVEASIRAGVVEVAGYVKGDIKALRSVRLMTGAEVVGDIETPTIAMAEGVAFEGRCTRPARPKSEAAPAPKQEPAPAAVAPRPAATAPVEASKAETPEPASR